MIRSKLKLAAASAAVLLANGAVGQNDGEAFDRTPQRCIVVTNIDETEAVDDQTIIFHMRGRAVYRNQLPRECPGLQRENRIAYEARTSRLCSNDTVTVLMDTGFGGIERVDPRDMQFGRFRRGFTCRLGEFIPMSPADVEELELRQEGRAEQRGVETREIELPPEDDEDSERDDAEPEQD